MTRIRSAILVTLGDPGTLTGGYLYHRRMAELAQRHGFVLEFASFPQRPFPLAILDAPRVLERIAQKKPDGSLTASRVTAEKDGVKPPM